MYSSDYCQYHSTIAPYSFINLHVALTSRTDGRILGKFEQFKALSVIENDTEALALCFPPCLNRQSAATLPTNATEYSNVLRFNNP